MYINVKINTIKIQEIWEIMFIILKDKIFTALREWEISLWWTETERTPKVTVKSLKISWYRMVCIIFYLLCIKTVKMDIYICLELNK